MKEYRKPLGTWIGRGPETEKLYELEEKRNNLINLAAKELGKTLGFQDYWRETVPEALLSILENFDTEAATVAACAYLEKQKKWEIRTTREVGA